VRELLRKGVALESSRAFLRSYGLVAAAAVLLAVAGSARAAEEIGPMRLGLPGLWNAIVSSDLSDAPLRFGFSASHGIIDDGHGFVDPTFLPGVTTEELRFEFSLRLAHLAIVSASMPWRRYDIAQGGTVAPFSASGKGDFQASAFLPVLRLADHRLNTGFWGSLRLPSGNSERGLSTNQTEGEFGFAATLKMFEDSNKPETRFTLNVGYRINKNDADGYGNLGESYARPDSTGVFAPQYPPLAANEPGKDNDQLLLRAGIEVRRDWAHLFLEYSADWLAWYPDASYRESASWITPGIYLGSQASLAFKAAWAIGLWTDEPKTSYVPRVPDWIFSAGVSYPLFFGTRDRDGDGIPDKHDDCVDSPEDHDGFQDEDGCPDYDNDGDGIPDRQDLAPNQAEDYDGFEDQDGIPDLDNDGDGIPDIRDACPNDPEDFNGFMDNDGCPDGVHDIDGDGIPDSKDICPNEPEDLDGFEDQDGCPDLDNDLDGIPDTEDKCPMEPEDYNGYQDDDGCPDAVVPTPNPAQKSKDSSQQ
jgi:hypothetical protein